MVSCQKTRSRCRKLNIGELNKARQKNKKKKLFLFSKAKAFLCCNKRFMVKEEDNVLGDLSTLRLRPFFVG